MKYLLRLILILNVSIVLAATSKSSQDDSLVCSTIEKSCIPHSALVNCSFLPESFLECDSPLDLKGNKTEQEVKGYGCSKFGGWQYEDVQHTAVMCRVLDGIECCGARSFLRHGKPCVKYSGHYFTTTLIYSLLLGFLGLDRFCLGLTGTAVGKLLTLGGFGVWWVVDIVLLVTGSLTPEDGSNWNTNV
ncbi:TM2 domain [Trinorchestia longiramus]|nr:TM2 domain [Trinorchestia longiramus]